MPNLCMEIHILISALNPIPGHFYACQTVDDKNSPLELTNEAKPTGGEDKIRIIVRENKKTN